MQLSSLTFWQFPMSRFSIGSYSYSAKSQAISQTAAWIGAPTSAVAGWTIYQRFNSFIILTISNTHAGIASATGAKFDQINYLYTVPCTGNYPDMILTIGGRAYNVRTTTKILILPLK